MKQVKMYYIINCCILNFSHLDIINNLLLCKFNKHAKFIDQNPEENIFFLNIKLKT